MSVNNCSLPRYKATLTILGQATNVDLWLSRIKMEYRNKNYDMEEYISMCQDYLEKYPNSNNVQLVKELKSWWAILKPEVFHFLES
jgi:hypothetical protein